MHGNFIENPKGSRMWEVPCMASLFHLDGVTFTIFDSCMHGGSRDKGTGLLHNCSELKSLAAKCDGNHTHKKWGVGKVFGRFKFDTSEEAEYPCCCAKELPVPLLKQPSPRDGRSVLSPKASLPTKWWQLSGKLPAVGNPGGK